MPKQVSRFSFAERAVHWLAALSFLYAALSGLALWSHHLYWLATILGGGVATRWGHPWGGIIFSLVLGAMFLTWARQMRLSSDDRVWLRNAKKYAVHDEEGSSGSGSV